MKIRSGFVSNSSSSSFIICYALINDEAKARPLIDNDSDITIYTEEELEKAIKESKWSHPLQCDWAGVYVEMKHTGNPKQLHMIFSSYGGAGDGDYAFDLEDTGNLDYDVNYNDFSEADFIDKTFTKENGFIDIEVQYGAGRNG